MGEGLSISAPKKKRPAPAAETPDRSSRKEKQGLGKNWNLPGRKGRRNITLRWEGKRVCFSLRDRK